ncbi:MAG TPA: methyltransferase [Telluria sp.]|nr:methyltransferase [Telluria sp.]
MKRLILAALLAAGAASASHAYDPLKAAIEGSQRVPANVARDAARHPYETLSFFGIRPDMTVVELSPSGGWYTEILAPYLRDKGKLIGAAEEIKPENRYAMAFRKKLDSNPAVFDKVAVGLFEPGKQYNIAPAGSVDMVLTFRNMHNWIGIGDAKMNELLKAVHTTLKPGGVFGVVDHRLPASIKQDERASSGYVHEAWVIKTVEAAGFKLVAKSEVNANKRDTADHPRGVWTLPPSYAMKDVDREKYQAIGESDRMTLKFVKQ